MSLTITGTPAAAPAGETRANFRTTLRRHLADVASASHVITWSDDVLNTWINGGLDELSRHVPKRAAVTHALTAGQSQYTLSELGISTTFLGIIRLEYPTGEDPRSWLLPIGYRSDAFGPGAYDFLPPDTLLLGDTPVAGESLCLFYLSRREHPAGDTSVIDLPPQYLSALREWIVWQSVLERRSDEMQAPTQNSLLLSLLDSVAMHHERTYQAALKAAAVQAQATVSPKLPDRWRNNPWA